MSKNETTSKDNSVETAVVTTGSPKKRLQAIRSALTGTVALFALASIVIIGASFYAGTQYQSNHLAKSEHSIKSEQFEPGDDFPGGMMERRDSRGMRGFQGAASGEVTAISATSISVKLSSSDSDKTYAISNETSVSKSGKLASVSDIQKGLAVMVITGSDQQTASRIIIDPPTMGSGGVMYREEGNSSTL